MRYQLSVALTALFLSTNLVSAQEPAALVAEGMDWRVPIHAVSADPGLGEAEIWAAGPGYKVSFHGGMRFYPALGAEAPANLPLGWQTTSVRVGGQELLSPAARPSEHQDAWRFEYRFGPVSEIYDVRADGVEQSFVIARPARIDGDVEVIGRWSGPLTPIRDAVAGSAQAALRFVDDQQRDIVRYGEAIAFDAAGRTVDVATSVRADTIRLTVPAAWVKEAVWPITIDPLLAPQSIGAFGPLAAEIEHSDVLIALDSATHRAMTAFSLPFSATDSDTYAVLTDENFQNRVLVFADISANVRTTHPRVAFVDDAGSTGRWTIAMERQVTFGAPLSSRIAVWLHDGGNTTFQSGSMLVLPPTTSGWHDRNPDIGGSRNDEYALLVYESDRTGDDPVVGDTEVHRVLLDADAGAFAAPQLIDSVPIFPFSAQADRGFPSVSQTSDGAPLSWLVCYQQRGAFTPANWFVKGRKVYPDGTASPTAVIARAQSGSTASYIRPSVDGANTRYGVAFLVADSNAATSGDRLWMTRFIWAPTNSQPTVQWTRAVDSASLFGSLYEPRVVADVNVGNWALAYRRRGNLIGPGDSIKAARIGFDGAVVESQTVYSNLTTDGAAPAIAFDFLNKRFLLTYGTDAASSPVFGRLWTYPVDALNIPYGSGCAGQFGQITTPLVGTEFFRVRLTGAMPGAPAALMLGGGSADIDLGVIGMTGCKLLLDPTVIISLPATVDAAGDALITIPFITVGGDLYMQWLHASVGANPANLVTTEGMLSQIR